MPEDQGIEVINATIYKWQKDALRERQERQGLISLSEALRGVLSESLPRPVAQPEPEPVA